jgi:hypothetical protein
MWRAIRNVGTPGGAYITKDGRNSPRKIDAAVAAVIAHDRARWHVDNPTPVWGPWAAVA